MPAFFGGRLVEFSYSGDEKYKELQKRERAELSIPDVRRGRLRRLLEMKGLVTVMEAHGGLTERFVYTVRSLERMGVSIEEFRKEDKVTPIVLVPTSFNSVKEEEWKARGANVIIYANHLMRATVPAIQQAAESILRNHRAEECDAGLMPFKDIIRLIPEE